MSRFGMGFGKDPPKHILSSRPAMRVQSAKCQEVLNKWFAHDEESTEQRPDWFLNKHVKPNSGPRDEGEWELVWRPRSRMDSPTLPARKVLTTLKDDEEKERLMKMLSQQYSKVKYGDTDAVREGSKGSKRLPTPGSGKSVPIGIKHGGSSKRLATAGSARSGQDEGGGDRSERRLESRHSDRHSDARSQLSSSSTRRSRSVVVEEVVNTAGLGPAYVPNGFPMEAPQRLLDQRLEAADSKEF